jgi:hypothetical protein
MIHRLSLLFEVPIMEIGMLTAVAIIQVLFGICFQFTLMKHFIFVRRFNSMSN